MSVLFGTVRQRLIALAELSRFGHCDAGWLRVIVAYYWRTWFGSTIPYRAASSGVNPVIDIPEGRCRIAIIGDWGTGTQMAQMVLDRVAGFRREEPHVPFILIHVGDVYYSGSRREFERFAAQIRTCFPTEPVYTLSGNHDMYGGGAAYYDCISTLNPAPYTQQASFFVLRNSCWQLQAMDTGLHDTNPSEVNSNLTFLDPGEVAWHRAQIAARGTRKVVLFSHHQPFSAFSPVGQDAQKNAVYLNRRLLSAFDGQGPDALGTDLLPFITAWFFGHEHNTVIYEPYAGVSRARCLGSSAVPTDPRDCDPYHAMDATITWDDKVRLSIHEGIYTHGYAILDLDGPSADVRYFQYPGGSKGELLFLERL